MSENRPLKDIVQEFTTIISTLGQRQIMLFMNRSGLSHAQIMTIGRLYSHGGVGISDMGAHMGTTDAAASQLIDRLVNQGLVERNECSKDRRKKEVMLTARGREIIETMGAQRSQLVDELMTAIPEEKQALIAEAMAIVIEAARKVESKMNFDIPQARQTVEANGKGESKSEPQMTPPLFPFR